MSVVHKLTIAPNTNPRHVVPVSDGFCFAFPFTKTSIGISFFHNLNENPVYLEGHRKNIKALSFSHSRQSRLLCSAADDYVIVWNVKNAYEKFASGERIKGQIIGTRLDDVNHCAFSTDDTLVAVCAKDVIYLLQSNEEKTVAILDGHTGTVTAAEFCPHYTATVVSIAEDRTFIVWDVNEFSLIYQSTIISSSPFISIAMNWSHAQFAIGTSDGIIRTYDLSDGNNFRPLHQMDVEKLISKEREKLESNKNNTAGDGPVRVTKQGVLRTTDDDDDDDVSGEDSTEYGYSITSLKFVYPAQPQDTKDEIAPQFENSVIHLVLQTHNTVLLVATTGHLLQINPKNHQVLSFVPLRDSLPSVESGKSTETIGACRYCEFGQGPSGFDIWAIIGTYFEDKMHILQWHINDKDKTQYVGEETEIESALEQIKIADSSSSAGSTNELSIVATSHLCEKSPLNSELVPNTKNDKNKKTPTKKLVSLETRRKSDPMNQPLTFTSKVKSSGYADTPKMKMFQPTVSKTKSAAPTRKRSESIGNVFPINYPANSEPCRVKGEKVVVAERPTPINMIAFSDDGKRLACALSNKTASIYRHPIESNKCCSLVGHDGVVNTVAWSHSGSYLLTASDDRTVAMWPVGGSDPVMKIDKTMNNFSVNKEQLPTEVTNLPFEKEIKHAQFYYMDKFILVTSAGFLYMYKYYLDPAKEEIKRYIPKSFYKLVQKWETDSVTLTSMAAVNAFHSHIVICAGSNRNIELFDMNVGRLAKSVPDSHSRPVHSISLNRGSANATQPQSAYNLFASAALADCIKLWDVRTQKCIQRLEGHLNKAHNCGLEISPCGTYLASGSEDKCVYIFDLRTGTYCEKLRGQTNVVSDVAYHPAYPCLVTGSFSGSLLTYLPK